MTAHEPEIVNKGGWITVGCSCGWRHGKNFVARDSVERAWFRHRGETLASDVLDAALRPVRTPLLDEIERTIQ